MNNIWKSYLLITAGIFAFVILARGIYSATFVIDSTVKISVCGNGTKEGGEQCDNDDLGGNSCDTVGYTKGILTCTNSCEFDTTLCIIIPTSTPSPTPTAGLSSTPGSTATPDTTNTPTPRHTSTFTSTPTAIPTTSLIQRVVGTVRNISLPTKLAQYDLDSDSQLNRDEALEILPVWVDSWRSYIKGDSKDVVVCDVNTDGICSLADFSVILYYTDL